MPVEVKYLDGGQGVVAVMSGFVTGDEVIAANAEIYSRDIAAKPYYYQLVDCDRIEGLNVTTPHLVELAQQDIEASKYLVHCVVGIFAKNDLPFALARMWLVFVERTGWDTHVFRQRSEMADWVKERVFERFGVAVTLE